ncbi:hypothetical protein BJ965_003899 [Streptomyces luteogriseus]|uniref:Tyr recombinase domain-containing protein n=1 Tax=Streptomyces luteogriseus TaxID=68233 RepID=A0A7W7GG92_9ACTN|nr:hypothetical protein [Streptomyces luteogriseus]
MISAAIWCAGKPLRYNQWRKAYFDPAVPAAGLTDVTPHDLRASHGTWVADKFGVMTAAHRLGHSNASATTRHYARPVAGRDDQVAEAADSWPSGHDGPMGHVGAAAITVTGLWECPYASDLPRGGRRP